MKKITNNLLKSILAIAIILSIASPTITKAATTPSLGTAGAYGILSSTFTRNIGITSIIGNLGYTTLGGSGTHTVSGSTFIVPPAQAGTDQANALSALNIQACTFTFAAGAVNLATDTTHGPLGVYTPGVYCTQGAGAASIGTAGITLSGSGTFIFRINGAFTSVDNSNITLANSASSCDVFWTPTAATTLGANTTFKGTIIDDSGITIGNSTALVGRALAFNGTVTTDTATIDSTCATATPPPSSPQPATINVVKMVINDNGGNAIVSDFPLFVNGTRVYSGVTNTFNAPGPAFTITETSNSNYARTFSGSCDVNGQLNLIPGDNKICIVTNNDIGPAVVTPPVPPLIDVIKTASPLSLPAGPGQVVYTYTLRNIGTVPVTNISMVGDTCSPIVLASGDSNNDSKLDVNEVWVHTCTTYLQSTHTNIVTTMGWANGISATDIASATVVVGAPIIPPLIHIIKKPNVFTISTGGTVTYTYTITNPGTAPLANVTVTDDKCTGLPTQIIGHPGDLNKNNLLENNESWTFTCKSRLYQTTTNIGTARGTANGLTATDFAIATVVVRTPTLPTTGFPPQKNDIVIMVASIVIVLLAFYARRKKIV